MKRTYSVTCFLAALLLITALALLTGISLLIPLAPGLSAACVALFLPGIGFGALVKSNIAKPHIGIVALAMGIPMALCWVAAFVYYGIFYRNFSPLPGDFPALNFFTILAAFVAAIGEEIGWRGFLFPILEKRFSPLSAAVLTGLVWGVWNLRLDAPLVSLALVAQCIVLSVSMGWLYLHANRNIIAPILFHALFRVSCLQYYGTVPSAGGYVVNLLLFGALALLCICFSPSMRVRRQV